MDLLENEMSNPLDHWYYFEKFRLLSENFDKHADRFRKVADIGAGSALFSRELAKRYPELDFIAVDINYTQSQLLNSKGNLTFVRHVPSADYYILTDVLEHIEDEELFLREIVAKANPGALFFITVPALQILWSGHDVFLRHFRRYSRSGLKCLVNSSELIEINTNYLFFILFPIAFVVRRLKKSQETRSQMRTVNPVLNCILRKLNSFENLIHFRKPFGVSLYCIAKKAK